MPTVKVVTKVKASAERCAAVERQLDLSGRPGVRAFLRQSRGATVFTATAAGTRVCDWMDWVPLLGFLGALADRLFLERRVRHDLAACSRDLKALAEGEGA